jgi:hypothetical protein
MSKENRAKWKRLDVHQRKEFWISSAAHIAEQIANPSKQWNGFLTLDKWEAEQRRILSTSIENP